MEPFKNMISADLAHTMARFLTQSSSLFDAETFIQSATKGLEALELKQRSNQFTEALKLALPDNFELAAQILKGSLGDPLNYDLTKDAELESGLRGWAIMPMADYVGLYGQDHFAPSMDLFEELTQRLSAEFAIRHFLDKAPEKTLQTMMGWTDHKSHHVRRLASEGCRPRLPWGIRLNSFVKDPGPLFPILEKLRDDEEEYVRRSVANNLNDIAKDHPELITKTAKSWLKGADKNRQRLVKHACRSLIKQGHQPTLEALGYGAANVKVTSFNVAPETAQVGEHVEIAIEITSHQKQPQPLIIDYAIHHQKANGATSPKVFKWKIMDLKGIQNLKKKHSLKPVTTRTYYKGTHKVELLINGQSFGTLPFELEV